MSEDQKPTVAFWITATVATVVLVALAAVLMAVVLYYFLPTDVYWRS